MRNKRNPVFINVFCGNADVVAIPARFVQYALNSKMIAWSGKDWVGFSAERVILVPGAFRIWLDYRERCEARAVQAGVYGKMVSQFRSLGVSDDAAHSIIASVNSPLTRNA